MLHCSLPTCLLLLTDEYGVRRTDSHGRVPLRDQQSGNPSLIPSQLPGLRQIPKGDPNESYANMEIDNHCLGVNENLE
jgi:hypothetical protein